MKLLELFLVETSEEDRAIVSLASAIYKHIQKYAYEEHEYDNPDDEYSNTVRVGKVGDIFDTPLEPLRDLNIQIQSNDSIERALKNKDVEELSSDPFIPKIMNIGYWWPYNKTMTLNSDFISTNVMKRTIAHELRHALDDFKSDFKAGSSKKYATPKNKAYRKSDNDGDARLNYLAQPAEINARFIEVLSSLVPIIKRLNKVSPDNAQAKIMEEFYKLLESYKISHLFPEKEKSADYKRLIKRAVDFIEKELTYARSINT